jgi:D-aminoacyl-tRNA deacylase
MRAVVSRVSEASVTVAGEVVGAIRDPGLLVLVGMTHDDTPAAATRMATKVANLRILRDEVSVLEAAGAVLVVSQFTLYGDTKKGRRPSWVAAAPGAVAEPLVTAVVEELRRLGVRVETGLFGATMSVHSVNDGPFIVLVEV